MGAYGSPRTTHHSRPNDDRQFRLLQRQLRKHRLRSRHSSRCRINASHWNQTRRCFTRIDENKFSLLFAEADSKNGEILAGVLREKIRRLNMPNHDSPTHSAVTASFGVATVTPNRQPVERSVRYRTCISGAAQCLLGELCRFRTVSSDAITTAVLSRRLQLFASRYLRRPELSVTARHSVE